MNTTSSSTSESEGPAAWWQAFDESEATIACQYVWGARPGHRDELILRDRVTTPVTSETSSEPQEPDERLWSLMDYYDPTSTVSTAGEVVERYRFSAFGLRSILAPNFNPRVASDYKWDFAFKGQFLDVDTGYYNYGYRYYSPELGRWLSRDPVEGALLLYTMTLNNALNDNDPHGLRSRQECLKYLESLRPHIDELNDHFSNYHCGFIKSIVDKFQPGGPCSSWADSFSALLNEAINTYNNKCKQQTRHHPIPCRNLTCERITESNATEILIAAGLITVGVAIIIFDIVTVPSGEGACGVALIRWALAF